MLRSLFTPSSGRPPRDRGAVLVEAALAIPLLLVVIFGAVEAGMAWDARSSTTSGVRTGLLRAASLGDKPETDLRILQSVIGEIGADDAGDIEWIVVFDATDPDYDGTIADCAAAIAGGGIADTCNTYSPSQIQDVVSSTLTMSDFDSGLNGSDTGYTCETTSVDANWCAGKRRVDDNDVLVGVALSFDHDWFTGILPGDGVTFTEYAVSSTLLGDGTINAGSVTIDDVTPVDPPDDDDDDDTTGGGDDDDDDTAGGGGTGDTDGGGTDTGGTPADTPPVPTITDDTAFYAAPTMSTGEGGILDSNTKTHVLQEAGPYVLTSDLTVNRTSAGAFDGGDNENKKIPAGTQVCSYMAHGDRLDDGGKLTGSMTFTDRKILGLVYRNNELKNSTFLEGPDATYVYGPMEGSDKMTLDLTPGANTVTWNMAFGPHLDQIRVIVEC